MEPTILKTIELFSRHAMAIENKKPGAACHFTVGVRLSGYGSDKEPKISLIAHFYDGENHQDVKAASFAKLVDEVYRRLGFADREAIENDRVEASIKALPPPDELEARLLPPDEL